MPKRRIQRLQIIQYTRDITTLNCDNVILAIHVYLLSV